MFRSIRWSLLFWYSLILLCVTGGFGAAIYYQQAHTHRISRDAELASLVQLLASRARLPGGGGPPDGPRNGPPQAQPDRPRDGRPDRPDRPDRPRPPRANPPPGDRGPAPGGVGLPESVVRRFEYPDGPYFIIWRRDGALARTSDDAPIVPYPGPVAAPPEVPAGLQFRDRGDLREAFLPGPGGMQVLVGRSTVVDQQQLRQLIGVLVGIGASVLCVGLLAGWLLANQIVHPIKEIEGAAHAISGANLSHRINVAKTQSELGGLAGVLNSMFARLETAFERQTRFTADASHELRTPLAVIHTEVESALAKPRSDEEYRASLETCLRAARRMRPLVDSLLVLARADAGQLELRYEACDLAAIVKDCAALVEPLAAQRAITLQLDLQPTPLSADAFRLTQVVANLLTNAILYNQPQGHVIVVLTSQSDEIMLTVADNGIGIPAQHLPRIFDRFFRVEESRSRELGGAGLGLSITKSIIEAHHGTITATSEPGNGATFRVRLPAHP